MRVNHTTHIITIPLSLSASQVNCYFFPESLLEKHEHTSEFRSDTQKSHCHTAECLQDNRHNVTMKCSKIPILVRRCSFAAALNHEISRCCNISKHSSSQRDSSAHICMLSPLSLTLQTSQWALCTKFPLRRSLSYSLFLQQKLSCQISYRYCPCTVVVTNETSPASCIHLFTTVSTSCTKEIHIYIYIKQLKARPKVYLSSILWVLAIAGHRTHWLRLRHSVCCDIGYRASGKADGTNLPWY